MSDTNTGGPAFPIEGGSIYAGMTLRDYFAAKAMQAMYANPKLVTEAATRMGFAEEDFASCLAMGAYGMADAMLKAREA